MFFLVSTFAFFNICLIPYYCISKLEYILINGFIPFVNCIYKIRNIKKRVQIKINYFDDYDLEKNSSDSDDDNNDNNNNRFNKFLLKTKKVNDTFNINNSSLMEEDIMIIDDKYSIIVE